VTYRDVLTLLRRLGAVPLRTKGSHQTWALPDGTRQTVLVNHLGRRADWGLLAELRKRGVMPPKETTHA
jgi:predicted RNA binding protein YcfA (HicA-like mRNA interferase family)